MHPFTFYDTLEFSVDSPTLTLSPTHRCTYYPGGLPVLTRGGNTLWFVFLAGVHTIAYAYPKVKIITSAVDPRVNDAYHIIPGIGRLPAAWSPHSFPPSVHPFRPSVHRSLLPFARPSVPPSGRSPSAWQTVSQAIVYSWSVSQSVRRSFPLCTFLRLSVVRPSHSSIVRLSPTHSFTQPTHPLSLAPSLSKLSFTKTLPRWLFSCSLIVLIRFRKFRRSILRHGLLRVRQNHRAIIEWKLDNSQVLSKSTSNHMDIFIKQVS